MTRASHRPLRQALPRLLLTAAIALAVASTAASAQRAPYTDVALERVAEGLTAPLALAAPPNDGRLFVADQTGTVHVIDEEGNLLDTPFLDVSDQIVPLRETYDERGLLGLAFHPEYGENGRVFVYYSAPARDGAPENWDHTDRLAEFRVSDDDPNRADPESERLLMQVDQPQMNHNGGALAFDEDGLLYLSVGDGGSADDTGAGHPPLGNGQDVTTILGNILRIDIDAGDPYAIPDDNPFVDRALPDDHPFSEDALVREIWAWGFRHPWRMSFDREGQRDLFVGDAGENLREEVSAVREPGNYGWNIKEGATWFDPDEPGLVIEQGPERGPLDEPLIDPILDYPNNRGRNEGIGVVVIGGYVYRGEAIPELEGQYVFGDWSRFNDEPRGVLMVAAPAEDGNVWPFEEVGLIEEGAIMGFGEGADGELYVLTNGSLGPTGEDGTVWRLVSASEAE